ncbi:MAG TPA: XdhC family protein [Amnibacterium sp.]|nr:XdhC family protein [Amnibacterium sp.]
MLELADRLLPLLRRGEPVGVATAIDVIGSSPQALGSSMATTRDGAVIGSVSGGCVEAAALEGCRRLLDGGAPSAERFGFGDAEAALAGLACGGELDVLLHMLDGACVAAELAEAAAGRPAVLAVVTAGPAELIGAVVAAGAGAGLPGEAHEAALAATGLDLAAVRRAVTAATATGLVELECAGVLRLFVEVGRPRPVFAIVGATDLGRELAAGAAALGYRVLACDPRPAFGTAARMPSAESVTVDAPHRWLSRLDLDQRSAVALLTHDEDLDAPALAVALEGPAGFVGALGSRSTAVRRAERLRALGVTAPRIARLHSPMGLDLGGSSAAETALSILAEVLLVRTGSTGAPLVGRSGPIHVGRGS